MRLVFLLLASVLATPALAQGAAVQADPSPHTEASLVAGAASVRPGGAVEVALRLVVDPGWHVYWLNPGDSGLPVEVEWALPRDATAGPLRFPYPERLTLAGLTSFAHEGTVHFPARITVPADARGTVDLAARAEWLVCADVCLPAAADVALSLPVGDPGSSQGQAPGPGDAGLALALRDLPAPAVGWTTTAERTEGGYRLALAPPPGWTGTLQGATFFPSEKAVLDHAAEPAFRREGDAWAVSLPASAYAEAPVERLRGVLVGAEGAELVPGARAIELDVAVAGDEAAGGPAGTAAGPGLWAALALAFVGGLLLNLMPCVFPVLSLKLLSFAGGREAEAGERKRNGLAYGAGVVASFWVLAGLLLALRAGGEGLGWGFQLQSPPVVAALAALMTGLALNLLGVVEVGGRLSAVGGRYDRGTGTGGAFGSGVLATVVATPCTAPFMGAALGYALAQPVALALAVFTALGVGMALPLVALAFVPHLAARLPRPGPWMEATRQALAFPLLATAVWLVWVFGRQTGVDGAASLLLGLVLVGFAAWLVGRWPAGPSSVRARVAARGLAMAVLIAAVALVVLGARGGAPVAAAADGWEPYDAARVDALVAEGRPVFVDATAAWCLSCQVNARTTLHTDAVEAAFRDAGVARFRADWTERDPAITAFLARFGRSGVPMYAFYPGGGAEPVLLPAVLTPGLVLDALGRAGTDRAAAR